MEKENNLSKENIDDLKKINKYLISIIKQKSFGKVKISFQSGKLKSFTNELTIQSEEVKYWEELNEKNIGIV